MVLVATSVIMYSPGGCANSDAPSTTYSCGSMNPIAARSSNPSPSRSPTAEKYPSWKSSEAPRRV
jgi:hypothetical protein